MLIPLLLLKGKDPVRRPDDALKTGDRQGRRKTRCPRCAWEPSRQDLWMCFCLFSWHTFDTFGVCPSCDQKHAETQCIACHEWSPHADWYVDEEGGGDGA